MRCAHERVRKEACACASTYTVERENTPLLEALGSRPPQYHASIPPVVLRPRKRHVEGWTSQAQAAIYRNTLSDAVSEQHLADIMTKTKSDPKIINACTQERLDTLTGTASSLVVLQPVLQELEKLRLSRILPRVSAFCAW